MEKAAKIRYMSLNIQFLKLYPGFIQSGAIFRNAKL